VKILITGSTGMLGSSLLKSLNHSGHQLCAPVRDLLDLSDQIAVHRYVATIEPDIVLHCAATVGGINSNIRNPTKYILDNTLIDSTLVSACLANNVRNFLYMSSSCIYPTGNRQPIRTEDLLTGPLEPTNQSYALAKIAGMQMMESVSTEYQYAYKSLILSNMYGPGDNFDMSSSHLIAAVISKVFNAKKEDKKHVTILGNGKARREFTYVDDVSTWISNNLQNIDSFPNRLNLGYGKDYSVDEYYAFAAEAIGYTGTFQYDLTAPQGMPQKLMDSSFARSYLNWNPIVDPQEGIAKSLKYWIQEGSTNEI